MYEIISIDGGGTKTKGALYSDSGEILEVVEAGFSNPLVNYEESLNNICKVLNLLLDKSTKDSICILGISGTKELWIKNKLETDLQQKYNQKIILMTDLEVAYYSHFKDKPGILGIIGTGSSLITVKGNTLKMAGGWGHILQDYASGYKLSIETIRAAIDEYEKENNELSDKIKVFYKLEEFSNIKRIVYLEDKREVAKLSPRVFEWLTSNKTSNYGKKILSDIINNEIKNLSNQVYNFYNANFNKDNPIEIVLTGGLVMKNDFYYNNIKESLNNILSKNVSINRLDIDPVFGGFNIGKRVLEGM
ncbi:hypothetical protein GOQ27_00350 [Clostridium sp. D2Q-11]|uniref:ATPase BadF/BadG/BcrA/BcrD type domain-containing protein n=1 Tax=Anaeromonas frigoriresistens TaxID=2683708 RepID=A0A942Z7I0_9FIRM|nr:BadF/BadG/BcrA/BcrD ATPase family protein [Anaeromonas frigoriresistens]MBS4536889.1 hypothetical protein [Anaeromonas frigoriresistens]